MYLHDYIDIIGSLGAFISALIALYTVNEIKKQRLSTYKPELFLKSFCVSPSHNPLISEEMLFFKFLKYNDYSKRSENDEDKRHISVLYKMENLGFGVAKDVICEWDFDHLKAVNLLQSVMPENYTIKRSHNSYMIENSENKDFFRFGYDLKKNETQKIDYISPIQVQDHENKHTIPSIVIFSYYYYMLFKNNMLNQYSENFYHEKYDNMPKPKLKVSYRDLNDKMYKKEYILNITTSCTQISEDRNNTQIDTSKEFCLFYILVDSSTKK